MICSSVTKGTRMTAQRSNLIPVGGVPGFAGRNATIACGIAITIITVTVLAACGGTTTAQPTANDPATIAAANTASVSPDQRGTTGTPVGTTRGFGGLLTPGSGVSSGTRARPVSTAGASTAARGVLPPGVRSGPL